MPHGRLARGTDRRTASLDRTARRLLGLALEAAIKMGLPEVRTIQNLLDSISDDQQEAEVRSVASESS